MLEDVFGADGVSGPIANWFEPTGGESFVKVLLDTYIQSDLSVGTGGDVKGGQDSFTSLCERLPLFDDTCYLGSTNDGFFRSLAAKYIPFGDQIVAAVETVEAFLGEIEGAVAEEVEAFYKPEEKGSCAVLNKDMFGFYETPGSCKTICQSAKSHIFSFSLTIWMMFCRISTTIYLRIL